MKTTPKIAAIIIGALIICWLIGISADATYDSDTDYMADMIAAALTGDYEAGQAAEEARNIKIADMGLDNIPIAFDDLYLAAKIAQAEAGDVPGEAGDAVCQRIIEVVVNRVASPEFSGDTIRDIVYARGQYYVGHPNYNYFESVQPTERIVLIAKRVLEGERVMTPDVVFHSNAPMFGGEADSVYMGKTWGTMYFSYSSNRKLYE